jgi:hypothetical protein
MAAERGEIVQHRPAGCPCVLCDVHRCDRDIRRTMELASSEAEERLSRWWAALSGRTEASDGR